MLYKVNYAYYDVINHNYNKVNMHAGNDSESDVQWIFNLNGSLLLMSSMERLFLQQELDSEVLLSS